MLISKERIRKGLPFIVIFIIGFVFRYAFVFYIHPPEDFLFSDMQGYYDRAVNLYKGIPEDIYSSFYPPGTHYIYSVFFASKEPFLWIKWFNVLISSVTCILVYLISKEISGKKTAMIAFTICSFNYLFIDFAGYFMSETIYVFSLAVLSWLLIKSIRSEQVLQKCFYSVCAGFAIIGSASIKSSILLFIPLFGIWFLFNFKKYKILNNIPFYIVGFLPLLIALVVRFYSITGTFGIISTNGGFNFFQGRSHAKDIYCTDLNRGATYKFASPVAVQKQYDYNVYIDDGPYDSHFFYSKGVEFAKMDLLQTLQFSLGHIADLTVTAEIWPSFAIRQPFAFIIKWFNYLFFIIIIIPALLWIGIMFNSIMRGLEVLNLFPIVIIILTSAIYYGDPRFRVPFDIYFILFAATFYSYLYKRLFNVV